MQILKEMKHFWGSNISALRQIVTLEVGIVSMPLCTWTNRRWFSTPLIQGSRQLELCQTEVCFNTMLWEQGLFSK